jgi:hypothetical protein
MRALERLGNVAEAMRVYESLRTRLRGGDASPGDCASAGSRFRASLALPRRAWGVLDMYEHLFGKEHQMAAVTTKPKPVMKTSASHQHGILATPLASVVDRTSALSDEIFTSLETGERAGTEALGRFFITLEEALPEEVAATSEVAKKITESGLKMADRLIHTGYELLRNVTDSAARSLSIRDGATPTTVE